MAKLKATPAAIELSPDITGQSRGEPEPEPVPCSGLHDCKLDVQTCIPSFCLLLIVIVSREHHLLGLASMQSMQLGNRNVRC